MACRLRYPYRVRTDNDGNTIIDLNRSQWWWKSSQLLPNDIPAPTAETVQAQQ